MGTGVRMALDIGLHRRQLYGGPPNAQNEQWKRAFWTLFIFDRGSSWAWGRSGSIQDEECV